MDMFERMHYQAFKLREIQSKFMDHKMGSQAEKWSSILTIVPIAPKIYWPGFLFNAESESFTPF